MLDISQKFQSKVFVLVVSLFTFLSQSFHEPQADDALKGPIPFHQLHLTVSLFKMNFETSVNE